MRLLLLALLPLAAPGAETAAAKWAGSRIDIKVEGDFGASPDNVRAVANSAARSLWRHCPGSSWQTPGFSLFHHEAHPIALFDHGPDGRIRIGVTTRGTYWSQLAFQFSHEFAHALAGHCGDWRETRDRIRRPNPHLWLEEALCETASLFALRAMAREWEAQPPYPNWKSYAPSLTSYAANRIEEAHKTLPAGADFPAWLRRNEMTLRQDPVRRDLNLVVASRLLPIFERQPAGWEAMTHLNRGAASGNDGDLRQRLAAWRAACPQAHRGFVGEVATTLGARLP